ncbi:MAG: tripartite tricarboxylate transporter substrate binding protein [Dictyoglomaceae bacterium]|nr:tripartite tricarboxylate transporter substrate binding protein [Dictyoglomaceae bacterium]
MSKGKVIILSILLILFFILTSTLSAEPPYPSQPIKVIVPYAPGGASDITVRIMNNYIKEYLGQNFAVVNITGAGGTTGAREALKAKPDGYTVLWYHQSVFSNYYTGVADFNYDAFTPVCLALSTNRVVIARGDVSWNNLKDAIEEAKKRPGQVRLGAEIGATSHFQVIPLQVITNNAFVITASSGGDMDRITKILGGHMDLSPIALSAAVPYLKSGELKALAVLSPKRDPFLPNIPTAKELGIDAEFMQDMGFFMPLNTPKTRVLIFAQAIQKLLKNEACVKELGEKTFSFPRYMGPTQYLEFLKKENEKWAKLAELAGLYKPKK